jgi:hypothetical protein
VIAGRRRVVLVAAAVVAVWLAVLAPQLWDDRMRVLAFLAIVGVAAWAWGWPLRAKVADASLAEAQPEPDAATQAEVPDGVVAGLAAAEPERAESP